MFKYAKFSNNFSLFQKVCQKKILRENSRRIFFIPKHKLLQQVASDRQTGHHDAHHAHQLDEDVQ